jgi:ABC-type sugar transport system permease subunit
MATSQLTKHATKQPKKTRRVQLQQSVIGYAFLAPMTILSLVFILYPIIGAFRYAFYDWSGIGKPRDFVGWYHFGRVARDPSFWDAVKHTLIYTVVQIPLQLTLALALALVLNNPRLRLTTFYRAVYFLPVVTAPAVIASVLRLLLGELGKSPPAWMVDLGIMTVYSGFLANPILVLPTIIVIGTWHTFGYNLVFFLAALQTIPAELYEAATIDGAGRIARFRYITIPLIRPVGGIIVFLAILGALQLFDMVWVLTQGGPVGASETVATYIYRAAFVPPGSGQLPNLGRSAAAAVFWSILIMVISLVYTLYLRRANRRNANDAVDGVARV